MAPRKEYIDGVNVKFIESLDQEGVLSESDTLEIFPGQQIVTVRACASCLYGAVLQNRLGLQPDRTPVSRRINDIIRRAGVTGQYQVTSTLCTRHLSTQFS